MFDVVLVAPEIATNTGNIIRLCANTGARLHLVRPLGFTMDDRSLKRAGLDYHDLASVTVHDDATACRSVASGRRFTFSSSARRRFDAVAFEPDDVFVFGAERAGLTAADRSAFAPADDLAIPMRAGNRSLNLANAVAVVVYEAWRRHGYVGASGAATTGETLTSDDFDL
ncbi:MAG: tRNA (uridine(34)/cytosine(34)/5-carboxymethylaminomethyluridine(34)-2'-O)-methyltransferase TrmL [Acidimicrobiaceae bacterium]|nr:tRNA (uridine(34)/cytosine(34)/5-carboxymethylaminomethyluridine(34)-2'-O)-methyltransferase TrmL [Acidimicrobiaceae bacterium]